MKQKYSSEITIVGAGLAGCFLGILLAKRNFKVTIYERFSQKEALTTSKRSINITFHNYGVIALKKVGVWEEVKADSVPLKGSITKLPFYRPIYAHFRNSKIGYYSVRRQFLLRALINKAMDFPNLSFVFNTELVSTNRSEKTVMVQNVKSKKYKTFHTDLLVGADGVHSLVRALLQQHLPTTHIKNYSDWEYVQVSLTQEAVDRWNFTRDRAYASTRNDAILVALPNKDKTVNAMLAVHKSLGFKSLVTPKDIENYVKNEFPELTAIIPEITTAIQTSPHGSFITMKTDPWIYKDFMVLVGDSAHSVTPFIGHGVTVGFGDCFSLVQEIDAYGEQWAKVLRSYQEKRKKHADTLVDMSLVSFKHFRREHKADFSLIYARFESLLHHFFPSLIKTSVFEKVIYDPDNAYTFYQDHHKQRKYLSYVGAPILVWLTTLSILLFEYVLQILVKIKLIISRNPTARLPHFSIVNDSLSK